MKIAIIGRTETLYNTAKVLLEKGHEIPLVITSKEAPEYSIKAKDFEILALEIGAKFINTSRINDSQNLQIIKEILPIDIGVSMNYTGLIGKSAIELFNHGILNAHGGDLPRYRGNACQAWALINGEEKIGLCIHKMIGGELDSGDIITRDYFMINQNSKIAEVLEWMNERIPYLFEEAINRLAEDHSFILEEQSKNPADALRTYPRLPVDGKINWSQSNLNILRLINASSEPFSGAFCEYENQKMIIWNAILPDDQENYLAVPGQVCSINKDGTIDVITGSGKIKLIRITYNNYNGTPDKIISSIRKRLN